MVLYQYRKFTFRLQNESLLYGSIAYTWMNHKIFMAQYYSHIHNTILGTLLHVFLKNTYDDRLICSFSDEREGYYMVM